METSAKYHISFWKEIPSELSSINSMKCHMKPESVFPVTFPGQKPRGNISFFAVFDAVVHPVDVQCSNTGLYTLLTPAEDIHKVIHPK